MKVHLEQFLPQVGLDIFHLLFCSSEGVVKKPHSINIAGIFDSLSTSKLFSTIPYL